MDKWRTTSICETLKFERIIQATKNVRRTLYAKWWFDRLEHFIVGICENILWITEAKLVNNMRHTSTSQNGIIQ